MSIQRRMLWVLIWKVCTEINERNEESIGLIINNSHSFGKSKIISYLLRRSRILFVCLLGCLLLDKWADYGPLITFLQTVSSGCSDKWFMHVCNLHVRMRMSTSSCLCYGEWITVHCLGLGAWERQKRTNSRKQNPGNIVLT